MKLWEELEGDIQAENYSVMHIAEKIDEFRQRPNMKDFLRYIADPKFRDLLRPRQKPWTAPCDAFNFWCRDEQTHLDNEYFGTGTGWLIRGSDRFPTGFRPVSDRFQTSAVVPHVGFAESMSQCHFGCIVHVVIVSCPMHSHVGSAECHFGCKGVVTEIQDSGPKVVR